MKLRVLLNDNGDVKGSPLEVISGVTDKSMVLGEELLRDWRVVAKLPKRRDA